jgi:hypothetical protein
MRQPKATVTQRKWIFGGFPLNFGFRDDVEERVVRDTIWESLVDVVVESLLAAEVGEDGGDILEGSEEEEEEEMAARGLSMSSKSTSSSSSSKSLKWTGLLTLRDETSNDTVWDEEGSMGGGRGRVWDIFWVYSVQLLF